MNNEIDTISLYIGKDCNLNCIWCYDQANTSSLLDYDYFLRFFDNIIKNHISNIIIVGGEPLLHPRIMDILEVLHKQHIILVTNGILLSNQLMLNKILENRNIQLSISLKGFNRNSVIKTTGKDVYDKLNLAIKLIGKTNTATEYTYVFDYSMDENDYHQFVKFCNDSSINNLIIGEPRPYINESGKVIHTSENRIKFENFIYYLYDNNIQPLVKIQSPFCDYSPAFIEMLKKQEILISICSVKKGGAMVFDSNFNLILCDSCYDIKLGSYGENYDSFDSLKTYIMSEGIREVYNRFKGCPQQKCLDCDNWSVCGGGCLLNWRQK